MNADATGRLLRYDARTKQVTVLRAGLPYPNGVAMSADRTQVVVAHTVPAQAFRYWLRGAKAGQYELLADLPGYPDNVRRDARGGYWWRSTRREAPGGRPARRGRRGGRGADGRQGRHAERRRRTPNCGWGQCSTTSG